MTTLHTTMLKKSTVSGIIHQPITGHHFSHVHATFWLGIEHCSNRRQTLVPEESGPRFALHMCQKSVPESIYAIGSWTMCLEP